ncbi:DUF1456 family protein [Flavobacteriaceae bacterium Ap0902]|nr:DUF1456 family protein [Flavobacteriaceae bacterium Ap0902]
MTNNDILKRIRYTFDYTDQDMMRIFKLVDHEVNRELVCDWLKKEEVETYTDITDKELATFLNGFIIEHRGRKDGPQPEAESSLSNNMILRKLKIALNLQSEEIIALLASKGKSISKHELSAFFRNPDHAKYKHLNDQYLRNFLHAMQTKYKKDN